MFSPRDLGRIMLLRRISKHVKDQNWFAVFIDFAIVVIGVFIGLQVANWNDTQSTKAELRASLERLDKEITHNMELIDVVLDYYKKGKADMTMGREALNACDASPEGQAALERIFFDLIEDVQPNFATVALDQIADQGRYQELLTVEFQQDFGEFSGRLIEEHQQLTSHYENMYAHHVNFHPDMDAYFSGDPGDTDDYVGWGFKLGKPFEEMCRDASFRNRFINTIGFYDAIGRRLRLFKVEAESFQTSLRNEAEKY